MESLRLGFAQLNPTCGDLEKNLDRVKEALHELSSCSDLIVLSFLPLTGYPLLSLARRKDFLKACQEALEDLLSYASKVEPPIVMSHLMGDEKPTLSFILLQRSNIVSRALAPLNHRQNLTLTLNVNQIRVLITLEEGSTIGSDEVDLVVILGTRPYYFGEDEELIPRLEGIATKKRAYLLYLRQASAQDEFIYPGKSLLLNPKGKILFKANPFLPELKVFCLPPMHSPCLYEEKTTIKKRNFAELYDALVFALREYAEKNRFLGALLGLSGGIDSALVACLAESALGKDRAKALFMPTVFTSQGSKEDAYLLSQNLGLSLREVPIQGLFEAYRELCSLYFGFKDFTVAEENLQARIRANLLFYLSNRESLLVLSTSNKSEAATGYGTIYGDMAGGYAPLKDVYKTWVYELARYRNSLSPVIPEGIFTKAPSAELRPNQKDEDALPPYAILDAILQAHLEEGLSPEELIDKGFAEEHVIKTMRMLAQAEYKRRQTPIGPKVCRTTLGLDYILPVTMKHSLNK